VSDGRPTAKWLARQITEAFPWDSGLTFHSGRMLCTNAIERFGDIVAHPVLGGLHHRYARI
jgi:hypothetical protein